MTILNKSWHQPFTNKLLSRTAGGASGRTEPYLWHIKEALISHPTSPWTIVGSSNRTTASSADNWASSSDLSRGLYDTWPGSWMVLKSPASSSPDVWLMFDWTGPSGYQINAWITTVQPDLSGASAYRTPSIVGPACGGTGGGSGWLWSDYFSGTYEVDISALVAADGSFLILQNDGDTSTGDPMGIPEYWFLMFNRMQDVQPQDPYGFVFGSSNGVFDFLRNDNAACWKDFRTIHPDGSEVVCSLERPAVPNVNETLLARALCDDVLRGTRPAAWPIRVVSTTAGKESYKGYIEDFWWGANQVRKMGQPGFEGENMAVMQKGVLWVPALESYRW